MKLTDKDEVKLKGVHPDLIKMVEQLAEDTTIPFRVGEGVRSMARQKQLFAQGATKTMNSRHLNGHAVDLFPLVDGQPSWNWTIYYKFAPQVKEAAKKAKVNIEWGGDWRSFKDGPHWQLPWKFYPSKG